jgi:hypothetical protein
MLTTETATAGAVEYCAPSVIDEESDEDLVVPVFSKEEGNKAVLDVLRSDQDQHSAQSTPQDASLAPAALPNFAGSSSPRRNAVEESHISTRPSAPKIKIETPDPKASLPSPKWSSAAERVLEWKRRPRDDMTARPESRMWRPSTPSFVAKKPRELRPRKSQASMKHAQATSTSGAWTMTKINSKYGWRTRVRYSTECETEPIVDLVVVYLYNSASFKKPHGEDADLDIFCHTEEVKSPFSQRMKKAKTIRKEQSKDPLPETFAEHDEKVNWLEEDDMLKDCIPGSRIITLGFDIAPVLSQVPDFDRISVQLLEHLEEIRGEAQQRPTVFLGHVYGGILICHMLSFLAESFTSPDTISTTAGLFLFSCPTEHSQVHSQELANFYGAKTSDVLFSDKSNAHIMQQFHKAAASGLYSQHPQKEQHDTRGTKDMAEDKLKMKPIRIGFPIFQFASESEGKVHKGFTVLRQPSKIFGGVVETILTGRDIANALKFSSPGDIVLQRVLWLMQYSFKTHRIFEAVVAGNAETT